MTTRPHAGSTGPDPQWWDLGACNLKSSSPDDSNGVVAWGPLVKEIRCHEDFNPGREVSHQLGSQEGHQT